MNRELMEALDTLEKEKNISKETLLEAIEQSLIQACKTHFGKADNVQAGRRPRDLRLHRVCGPGPWWSRWRTRRTAVSPRRMRERSIPMQSIGDVAPCADPVR